MNSVVNFHKSIEKVFTSLGLWNSWFSNRKATTFQRVPKGMHFSSLQRLVLANEGHWVKERSQAVWEMGQGKLWVLMSDSSVINSSHPLRGAMLSHAAWVPVFVKQLSISIDLGSFPRKSSLPFILESKIN